MYFTDTVSRIGGISLQDIETQVENLHTRAFDPLDLGNDTTLDSLGMHKLRSGKEDHLYNPKTIHLLQQATWQKDYKLFKEYSREIDNEDRFMNLRSLLDFKFPKREFRFRRLSRLKALSNDSKPVRCLMVLFHRKHMRR